MKKIFETQMQGFFISINDKYTIHAGKRLIILTKEYLTFKKQVYYHCREKKGRDFNVSTKHAIRVDLIIHTYKDIDNMEKCIIDGMQNVIYKNDSKILEKHTTKIPQKKGQRETIKISVYEV